VQTKGSPTRSIAKAADDQEVGLWIDYTSLPQHRPHSPTILHDPSAATNNRYLQLADIALRKAKQKPKSASSE
jgi:hypothetical protein